MLLKTLFVSKTEILNSAACYSNPAAETITMEISNIHVVYLNETPMPAFFKDCVATWQRDYPSAVIRFWDSNNLPPLRNQSVYDACWHFAARTDVLRYELLHRFGGIYVDCDMMSLRPFDDLITPVSAFSSAAPPPAGCTGLWHEICILGAEQEHPFYEHILSSLPNWYEERYSQGACNSTGPFFYYNMLCEWKREIRAMSEDVCIFDPKLMMPFRAEQEHAQPWEDLPAIYPEARCVHWWAGSWWETEQKILASQ